MKFHFVHFISRHLARFDLTGRFEHRADADVPSLIASGQHRSAADNDGRDVQSASGHEHGRHDFIAVWDEDQAVEGVGRRHGFNGVANQFATRKGKTHAPMAHGNAVTDADRREFDGRTAGRSYAEFDGLGNFT